MRTLVLASTSRYRQELLRRLDLPFLTDSPGISESRLAGESLDAATLRLARAKAQACVPRHRDALIIGSDQLCAVDGVISGKPGSRAAAIEQLCRASGRSVEFRTAVAVLDARSGDCLTHVAENAVWFRTLTRAQVEDYVDRDRPLDCAGSFRLEGLGIALFERISGDDPHALVGLPLIGLCTLLERAGEPVLGASGARC